MATAPRNCRFLSLVAVELGLIVSTVGDLRVLVDPVSSDSGAGLSIGLPPVLLAPFPFCWGEGHFNERAATAHETPSNTTCMEAITNENLGFSRSPSRKWHPKVKSKVQKDPRSASKYPKATAFPCPSLFCFGGKMARKATKRTRISYPCRTPKIPGKEGKNTQKTRRSSHGPRRTRNSQKTRKGRTGFETFQLTFGGRFLERPKRHGSDCEMHLILDFGVLYGVRTIAGHAIEFAGTSDTRPSLAACF